VWIGYSITGRYANLGPGKDDTGETFLSMNIFLMEVWGTFLLCFFINNLKNAKTAPTKDGLLASFGVASALYAGILLGGPVSGACYNPAVGISVILFRNTDYQYLWIYIVAPLTGGLMAGLF